MLTGPAELPVLQEVTLNSEVAYSLINVDLMLKHEFGLMRRNPSRSRRRTLFRYRRGRTPATHSRSGDADGGALHQRRRTFPRSSEDDG